MKIVLDTNTWLSAIVWRGEANKIIEAIIDKKIEVIITQEILSEIIDVLNRERFEDFIENKKDKIEDLLRVIISISTLIETKNKIALIKEDPKDNIILEAASEAKIDYIVSYDRHLLNMIQFNKIKIITPADFLKLI